MPRIDGKSSQNANRPCKYDARIQRALEIARSLIEAGVPIFVAPRGMDGRFRYPKGWENTKPDPSVLERWKPGNALCAVMGVRVDGLDADKQHGGDKSAAELEAAGHSPRSYGRQRTPSGGTHDLIAPLGVGSRDGIAPGLDLKGGRPDGTGRGMLHIAPTAKISKTTGELTMCEWEVEPDLAPLLSGDPDDSGSYVAEMTREALAGNKRKPRAGTGDVQQRPSLREMLDNPPTRGQGRTHNWLVSVAGHQAGRHRDDKDAYIRACREAIALVDPDYEDFGSIVESVWNTDQRNHPGDAPVGSAPAKSEQEKPSAYRECMDFLDKHYKFFHTPDGEAYAIPRHGTRRPIYLSEKGEGGLKRQAQYDYERLTGKPMNNAAMTQALTSVYQRTLREAPEQRLNLRVAHPAPGMIVVDLAQASNTRCIVVTAEGWAVQDEPPPGVAFKVANSTRPLPEPTPDGTPEVLRGLLGWSSLDRRWLLVRGWIAAALLPDIARPVLFFHGRAGSSKTTKAVTVVSVIDPRDELGSSFGKNERDEVAMASNRYLVGFDNVSRASEETSDRLSRLVTGTSDERRTLYSDNDQFVVSFRRTGVITGLSIPGFKSDALERLIQIQCDTIPNEQRRSEKAIAEERAAKHPEILGATLTDLVTILRNLPESEHRAGGKPRMADFSDALHALDPLIEQAFVESASVAMVDAAESDPFVMTIKRWLGQEALPLRLSATEAHARAERHRDVQDRDMHVWWPKDARSFAGALTRQAGPLEAVGIRTTSARTKRSRTWLFEYMDQPSAVDVALFDDEEPF